MNLADVQNALLHANSCTIHHEKTRLSGGEWVCAECLEKSGLLRRTDTGVKWVVDAMGKPVRA